MRKLWRLRRSARPTRWAGNRSPKSRLMDFGLGLTGVGIALVSSYLPYYVYNNVDQFGPPKMTFTGRATQNLEVPSEDVDEIVVSSIRRPLFENDQQEVDPIVTGSVRNLKPVPTKDQARIPAEQRLKVELPREESTTDLRMVFAARGRALIRDGDDILPVAVGSRLPDGSIVKSVAKSQDRWQLLTSTNLVLEISN